MTYRAPLDAIRFSLEVNAGLARDMETGEAGELSPDMLRGILEEAARFAEAKLAPQNHIGDRVGAAFADASVTMPDGWRAMYGEWAEAGWNGMDLPEAFGGMGLPTRLAAATMEIWTSACMSFALGPVLTQGAVETLAIHASEDLKATYLPRLVSGEWAATMNLTEPQAGSDLSLLRTKAVPHADGTYRLSGNKIFITYGDHDLTANIIHLVLARLPDAPEGTKGISLFLVPKFLVKADGTLGARNDVICTGLEHKLGIHASPTCSMSFGDHGGAIGWLIGEPHRGLACMFTMMNKARLFTGLQGVAIAERAWQQALTFAQARKQGRAKGAKAGEISAIIDHPDVQRNLLTMRALTAAARAIAHQAAFAIDRAQNAGDPQNKAAFEERAALLTPITKAYCSDVGCEVASLGVQIHGGMGYVEETGAAQHFRDARITPIYEGTNGIQAIDLVMRKVLRPGSTLAEIMIGEFESQADSADTHDLPVLGAAVRASAASLRRATHWLREHASDHDRLLGAASPYLRLFATSAAIAFLTKSACVARARQRQGSYESAGADSIANAHFYAQTVAVFAPALAVIVMESRIVSDFLLPSPGRADLAGGRDAASSAQA
ncbi:CaiA Acyl-CoA dehydrogenases [Rhabdaerophilaceae bacterium]